MKRPACSLLAPVVCGALTLVNSTFAQGTAFTYQGHLAQNGSPASGSFDLAFSLYSTNSGGAPSAVSVTNYAVNITNGLFTTTIDFGSSVWNGQTNWLQIGVETNGGGGFTDLTPRQELTPAPYAIYAESASAAGIAGTLPGTSLGGTYSNSVTLNNGANKFDGTFSGQFYGDFFGGDLFGNFVGSGSDLTDVWHTTGNFGTLAGLNFLGTTDNQPLEVHVYGLRAARWEPTVNTPNISSAVNVIQGSSANNAGGGVHGAAIGGGGAFNYFGTGGGNNVLDNYDTIAGGVNNNIQTNCFEATIGGGNANSILANSYRSTISGGWDNTIGTNASQSFIGGGVFNQINADVSDQGDSVVSGGYNNVILTNAPYSAIGGGLYNRIYGDTNDYGTGVIAGGDANIINSNSWNAFIGGGQQNTIGYNSDHAYAGGGQFNNATAVLTTVGGGEYNTAAGVMATVGGGYFNRAMGSGSVIAGGGFDGSSYAGSLVQAPVSVIGGGLGNWIQTNANGSTIAGGYYNQIQSNAYQSTIGGGYANYIETNDYYSTISGGFLNQILMGAFESTIGGGFENFIRSNAYESTISGGAYNLIDTNSFFSAIGGGYFNQIQTDTSESTIAGGYNNQIQTNCGICTIGGGSQNQIQSNSSVSTIAGGYGNVIQSNSFDATIGGGNANKILTYSGFSTIGGGFANTNNGQFGIIPGGTQNVAGNLSFAAGNRAKALFSGDFVWADSQNADFTATAANQVSFRCQGGVVFSSGTNGLAQSVTWVPGSGAWSFTSDRNAKENFKPVDALQVLEKVARLPLTEWNYKGYSDRHVGPMAQDFHDAFPFNSNDKMLNSADETGVSLAAIQGLNQKLDQKEVELQNLKDQNNLLTERLNHLEAAVRELTVHK
jgi:hypothetical protein